MDCQLGCEGSDETIPHPLGSWELCNNVFVKSGPDGEHGDVAGSDGIYKVSNVSFVEAGSMMSCAVDQDRVLWMWGHCRFAPNEEYELPFSVSDFKAPHPVSGLQGLNVTKVACGNEHVLALVDDDLAGKRLCYAWGSNKHGQLGLGDQQGRILPQLVEALDEQDVGSLSDVSCGAYHSAVVTHKEKKGEVAPLTRFSMCWTFGMGENGQLGHGDSESVMLPRLVEGLPSDKRIVAVSCGLFHMGAVCEAGGVWIWGMEKGLGLCPGLGPPGMGGGDYLLPVRVTGSEAFAASHGIRLACGAAHTVLASENDGECILWAWGRGQSGVLGTGQNANSVTPCRVVWPPCSEAETNTSEGDTGHVGLGYPSNISSNQIHLPKPSPFESSDMVPLDQTLALAQKEIWALTTELSLTKRHYASLYGAVYGPSDPSDASNSWEALKEWDRKVAESSYDDLVRLDDFYRQARGRVKEALLQKKVENYCNQFLKAPKGEATKDIMDQYVP